MLSVNFDQINKIGFSATRGHFVVIDGDTAEHPVSAADYRKISAWADGAAVDDPTIYTMPADVFEDYAEFSMSTGWAG